MRTTSAAVQAPIRVPPIPPPSAPTAAPPAPPSKNPSPPTAKNARTYNSTLTTRIVSPRRGAMSPRDARPILLPPAESARG